VLAILLCLVELPRTNQQDSYKITIETWRSQHELNLTADTGWLSLTGLFFLHEGDNSFGTGPLNDIVIPEGPEYAGVFQLNGQEVLVRALNGQTLNINGEEIARTRLYPREQLSKLIIRNLTLFVHLSGDRFAIRMLDRNSDFRLNFKGLRWYPIDESYRIKARFIPHNEPVTVQIQNILGDIEHYSSNGSITLSIHGQKLRMLPLVAGEKLWLIFRDLTSGTDTYPAARFLYADAPRDGWTVLDFNMAYNPPCAFNPHTTCPLPPRNNRLPVEIKAGELHYPPDNENRLIYCE
jgi:hypothetical protein